MPFAAAALSIAVVLASFFGWLAFLNAATERARAAATIQPVEGPPTIDPIYLAAAQVGVEPERGLQKSKPLTAQARTTKFSSYTASPGEYLKRTTRLGEWLGMLVCKPLRLAKTQKVFRIAAMAIGWFIAIPFLWTIFRQCRQRDWMWLGLTMYGGVLVLIWTVNPRYLLPVAPLILAAILAGFGDLAEVARRHAWVWSSRVWRVAGICFVAGVVLTSGSLYGVDVTVTRSASRGAGAYYDRFEAGVHKELIGAAAYIRKHAHPNALVAVSGRYDNLGIIKAKPMSSRAMVMLTERRIIYVPLRLGGAPDKELSKWLREHKASYYLYQPRMSPWRVWHFRMPWLQWKMTGEPVKEIDGRWRLARLNNRGRVIEWVELPDVDDVEDLVRRVPGVRDSAVTSVAQPKASPSTTRGAARTAPSQ
jgi:hypothetical protein